jgi:hypothetical protein
LQGLKVIMLSGEIDGHGYPLIRKPPAALRFAAAGQ